MSTSVKTWKESWNSGPGPKTPKEYTVQFLKGFAMGTADLIPGVSGGTIAFVTGIYEGLLEAVASINKELIQDALTFNFKSIVEKVHLRFLVPLGFGMIFAIVSLARVMHYLINEQPIPTWATFFGLISASIIVVWKDIKEPFAPANLGLTLLGAIFAYMMVSLIPVTTPENAGFIFLCGVIGITAMILPGLSGSFLLLILGKYEMITGAIKDPFADGALVTIAVFGVGTATGLIGFSKILNYLIKHYRCQTMAVLTGVLLGSMKKVWPWKQVLETKVIRGKVRVLSEANVLPQALDGSTMFAIVLILVGFGAVLLIESKASND